MDFLHIDLKFVTLDTFLVQFALLVVILFVINKFIIKPYIIYLDEETKKREKLENDYRNIDELINNAKKESEQIIIEAKKKANSLIDEWQELWKRKRDSIIEKADNDAKIILESAKSEIDKERLSMVNTLKSKLMDLVLKLNAKMFWNDLANKQFIEKQIMEMKT